jgi:hypothetical protein
MSLKGTEFLFLLQMLHASMAKNSRFVAAWLAITYFRQTRVPFIFSLKMHFFSFYFFRNGDFFHTNS